MPVLIFEKGVIKVIPIDGALAGSEAEGCRFLVRKLYKMKFISKG
jgi:hypothetical protein